MHAVYILEYARPASSALRHRYYVGQAENVFKRYLDHTGPRAAYTPKLYGIAGMVFLQYVPTREKAWRLEATLIHQIKKEQWSLPEPCCSFISPAALRLVHQTGVQDRKEKEQRAWMGLPPT